MKTDLRWEQERRLVVGCSGHLGWEAREQLPPTIEKALHDGTPPAVILDLEEVELVDSAGLAALLLVKKLIERREGRLILANLPPSVQRVLDVAGLRHHIACTDTLAQARAALEGPDPSG